MEVPPVFYQIKFSDPLISELISELTNANMGANTFTEGAIELILRNANGNLRLCKNLCYGSLMDDARHTQKEVTINHVNAILIQPHWRTHKELLTQQVPK